MRHGNTSDQGAANDRESLPEGYKMTKLGPLPEEWQVIPFTKSIKGKARVPKVKSAACKPIGRIPVVDQGQNLIAGFVNEPEPFTSPLPVIVFGDHTRVFKFIDFPFVVGADGTHVLLPNADIVDPEYLFFFLLTVEIPSRGYNRHFHLLREKLIPLPPLPEQRAIAHVLRTVQEAKEATERVIAALRELKKSLMRHLFTYGPVPLAQAESVPLRDTEIGPIPAHWPVVRLGEVALFETGKRERGGASSKVGILSIGGEHITEDGTLDFSEPKYISKAFFNQMKAGKVKAGDVLVCKDGAKTGKSAFVNEIPPEGLAVNEHIFIVRSLDSTRLFPRFLGYWFLSQKAWDQIRCAYHGLIGGINREEIRAFVLPLPPLPEQQQIAAILQAVDRRIQAEEGYKRALEALFKTLLHELMTARRRLPQDFIACFTESPNASGGTS